MYYCKIGNTFLAAPLPKISCVFSRLSKFKKQLLRYSRGITPLSEEEVVETYVGRKRTIYQQALNELNQFGLRVKHAYSVAFVKVEKGNTAKAPRCIQPRKPVYNLVLGKYIKPLEHRMYKWIARVFGDGPTVMKGYNVKDVARIARGKWDSFNCPVAVGLDATKFDMHVSPSMLAWEHSIYNAIYRTPELRKLLGWQMNNQGSGYCVDGKLKYKVKGKRFSGDMNTALGNCIIMCALVWTYANDRGTPVKLINNGDDCVVFMEQADLDNFMLGLDQWFLDMGFRMTVEEPVYDFEKMEFCQMRPVDVDGEWIMVRNIKTALIKDTMCTLPINNETDIRKWMYSVGVCGLSLCSGVPIMQAFYQAYIRNGIDDKGRLGNSVQMQSGMRMLSVGLQSTARDISADSRFGVFLSWGITPDEQLGLEEFYNSWSFDWCPGDIVEEPIIYSCL